MNNVRIKNVPKVLQKLEWMKKNKIFPNGKRYLWTDSFGVVNYVSLYRETKDEKYIAEAEDVKLILFFQFF